MDDATIFQRTELGQKIFADSKAALSQAERTLLIMIDGRKRLSEFRKFSVVVGDCEAVLTRLTESGLIAAIASTGAATPPASTASPSSPNETGNTTHEQFERTRRSATRFINQALGVYGEKIALLVESSRTTVELRERLVTA